MQEYLSHVNAYLTSETQVVQSGRRGQQTKPEALFTLEVDRYQIAHQDKREKSRSEAW